MSSPEKQPLDPLPIDPPDNTRQLPDTEQNPDLALTDDEANLGLTDDAPAINPPDNT